MNLEYSWDNQKIKFKNIRVYRSNTKDVFFSNNLEIYSCWESSPYSIILHTSSTYFEGARSSQKGVETFCNRGGSVIRITGGS